MPANPPARSGPTVSVIVPARNEDACLAACLDSLSRQQGVACEIIVVDDASTDRTREIAASFPGVRVIEAGALAPGCSGKCNAAQAGADIAGGEWLLFTDADTVHVPGSLARSLAEARAHGAALLSYSPAQELRGFFERAVMPVIFAELATTYRPAEVNDPTSPVAAANGQYLLITREAYDAVGGHAAVSGTLLEDVALAQAVKRGGRRLRFRFGGDAVRARMYRSLGALCEGWTKNLALLFPQTLHLAAARSIEFLLAVAGVAGFVGGIVRRRPSVAFAGLAVATPTWTLFFRRVRRAHAGGMNELLSPLGLPVFVLLLLRSRLHYLWRRKISWKGRTYESASLSRAVFQSSGSERLTDCKTGRLKD